MIRPLDRAVYVLSKHCHVGSAGEGVLGLTWGRRLPSSTTNARLPITSACVVKAIIRPVVSEWRRAQSRIPKKIARWKITLNSVFEPLLFAVIDKQQSRPG